MTKPIKSDAEPALQGEGDRVSAEHYNEMTRAFVASGKVEQAANEAAPHNAQEAALLRRAESEGRSRSKGDDPVRPGNALLSKKAPDMPSAKSPTTAPGKARPQPGKAPGQRAR